MMKKHLFILMLCLFSVFAFAQDFVFKWRQISGPVEVTIVNPDSASTLVTGLNIPAEYLFEFSVTNMFGTGKDTCMVTVLPAEVLALDTTKKTILRKPPVKYFSAKALVKGDLIYIQVKSPKPQVVKVMLFNMLGQALAEAKIPVLSGENIFTLPKPRVNGVYILRFYNEIVNENFKLLI